MLPNGIPVVNTNNLCLCACHFGGLCGGCKCDELPKEVSQFCPVNKPKHYNQDLYRCKHCAQPIECIDITRHMSFNIGNVIKYLWRFKEKNGIQDLQKASWYLNDAITQLDKQ